MPGFTKRTALALPYTPSVHSIPDVDDFSDVQVENVSVSFTTLSPRTATRSTDHVYGRHADAAQRMLQEWNARNPHDPVF